MLGQGSLGQALGEEVGHVIDRGVDLDQLDALGLYPVPVVSDANIRTIGERSLELINSKKRANKSEDNPGKYHEDAQESRLPSKNQTLRSMDDSFLPIKTPNKNNAQ